MKHKRPWGYYQILLDDKNTKVKKIVINSGQSPSYQYHIKRSEVWIIIEGVGEIKINDDVKKCVAGDVIEIKTKDRHRITNNGSNDLIFIEVQRGTYFGEDDIVRIEDNYGRA